MKPEERIFSGTSRIGLNRRTVSGIQSPEGETGLAGTRGRRCPREFLVGLYQRGFEGDQSSVSSAGTQKKGTAVVRKESADTQDYESCQLNDMDVDMDGHKEAFQVR